jgi:hypothetical protein
MCVHFSFVLFYLSAENDDLAHSDVEWQSCSMLSLSDSLLDPGDILMGNRMVVRGGGDKVSSANVASLACLEISGKRPGDGA